VSTSTLTRRRVRRLVGVLPIDHATDRIPENPVAGRLRRLLRDDAGMSTVEYAIGCIAAAAFAAALYAVVSGDSVVTALTQLVQRALTAGF
jgi:Flp pilus assembly pilin Flp